MPEEFELPETPETPGSHKERTVGLIIATIAVVLAIVTHLGNEIHQEELLTHIDSSDAYSDYQAKKSNNEQISLNTDLIGLMADQFSPAQKQKADALLAGYDEKAKQNTEKGDKHKESGDENVKASAALARKASILDIGEIALQISVVLCSLTILTEQSLFVRMGMGLALSGVAVAAWAMLAPH